MKVNARPLDSLDRDKLVDLVYSIFPEGHTHWEIQKELEQSLLDAVEECSAVAWRGDKPVGIIIVVAREGLLLEHLGVLDNHRRMGIGRMLLRYAIDNTEDPIISKVLKGDEPTEELLEEEGFDVVDEQEDYFLYKYKR
ncbi:MAG: GNAT family N-acetyltransferase [Thermoplasmatota archaeon]